MLSSHFDIKYLGEINFIHGMKKSMKTRDESFLIKLHYGGKIVKYHFVGCMGLATLLIQLCENGVSNKKRSLLV